jgi:hypothetical protein
MEDANHDGKGGTETVVNWSKLYLQSEKFDQMQEGFLKWAVFPGPWQQMNEFKTQGEIQVACQSGNWGPSSILLSGGPFGIQCG